MNSIVIGLIVFVCVFGGALLGMFLSTRLPEHHRSGGSKDVVIMGMGLIGTMTALVLVCSSLRPRVSMIPRVPN
jgi:threonine dehydrogenase-like Zn-dependent dehydrogenase